ncbi:MAG: PVC-type heme-binding CxxCH protein [Planctomycetota bacterium]
MSHFLRAASCWAILLVALLPAAEPPQTGPMTEKRFPPLRVPPGFQATLFACDPLIEYPSAIALGPRASSLFVAVDYMTGLGTEIIRRDEIRLVEDSDGDGYADRAPVWADGFNSIQGLTFHDGAVFVMHSPFLTALRDTDGDGRADERRDIVTGLGLSPEKDSIRLHNANGVVAGHDGWLYLALGDHGCEVARPEGDRLVHNGGGILRCRFDGRDLHVFAFGLRNIYDVTLDDDLNVFVRDNENDGGNYKIRVCHSFFGADHGYPYLYDERPAEALSPLADLGLGSSAGGVAYREPQFPAEFRGLYFCEWGRAVMRYAPEPLGSSFAPLKEIEFAAGAENDPYGFKPTDLVVDRDGSLLVADWADGQRPKRGRARIYRISHATPTRSASEGKIPSNDLNHTIARLDSESYHERLEAQLGIERREHEGLEAVLESLAQGKLGVRGRMHAVWILTNVLGPKAIDDLFRQAQRDSDPRVRVQAVRALADLTDPVLTQHRVEAGPGDAQVAARFTMVGADQDPRVVREMIVALGRLRWAGAPEWLHQRLVKPDDALAHAVQQTLRRSGNWPAVLKLLDLPDAEPIRGIALRVIADQSLPEIVDGLIGRLRTESNPIRRREYSDALCRVHRQPPAWVYWGFRPAPRPANTITWERTEVIEQTLDRVLADSDATVRLFALRRMQREKVPTRAASLATWLRDETHGERLTAILDSIREHPADVTRELLESAITDIRKPATARLVAFAQWTTGLTEPRESRLVALAKSLEDGPILAGVLREIGKRTSEAGDQPTVGSAVGPLLIDKTNSRESEVRAESIETLAALRITDGAGPVPALLQDPDARVRRAAAFAAGQLEVRATIPALLNLARDADAAVRQASLDALRQLREPRVVPLAVAALSDAPTQLSALRCLAELGGPEHAPAAIEIAARNSSIEVLSLTVEMLTKWTRHEGLDAARRADLERAVSELQGTSGVLLSWRLIGPLPPDEAARLVESAGTVAKGAEKTGSGAQWRTVFGVGPEARVRNGGQVENPPHDKHAVWLAYADFHSSEPTAAQFLMSSNGPLRVRLNGRSMLERAEPRRFQPDADRFEAELMQGTNRLLVQLASVPDAALEFHARIRRKSSKAEHERLVEAALSRTGNVERGRKLFLTVEKSQCLKCHRLGELGERIGPELTGIGSRFSRVHIIESLLEPSRTIAAGFQSQTVALQDGRVLTGLKISETDDTLVLADNQGKKQSLRKADIEEQKAHPQSIMPDGLEKTFTADEFVDLISFLTGEKQAAGPYGPARQ